MHIVLFVTDSKPCTWRDPGACNPVILLFKLVTGHHGTTDYPSFYGPVSCHQLNDITLSYVFVNYIELALVPPTMTDLQMKPRESTA